MSIALISSGLGSSVSSTAETSRGIVLPTVLNDDLAVFVVGIVSASAPTITPPAGLTQDLALTRAGTSTFRMATWYKKLTAADTGTTLTWSSSVSGQLTILRRIYRGVHTTTALNAATQFATSSVNDSTPDCPSITPADPNAMVVTTYGMPTTSNTSFTDWTAPGGMSSSQNGCSSVASVNNAAVGSAQMIQASATATGVLTATSGPAGTPQAHSWVAVTMALKEAVAGGLPSFGYWGVRA